MKLSLTLSLFVFALSFCAFFSSCEPETIIESETETVRDTIFIVVNDTLAIVPQEKNITHFILLRHAEDFDTGSDPVLTPEGEERAERLSNILGEVNLNRVYSTDFNRTKQTATPIANDQGLPLSFYQGDEHEQVIDEVLDNENEGTTLIIGHTNTTANFLNSLTGTSDFPNIPSDEFDNMYIVSTKEKGDSKVILLKY